MNKILNNKFIIPILTLTIGLVGYMTNIYQDTASVMIVMGILGLMANCNEWSNPNPKIVNGTVLLSAVAFINPVLGLVFIILGFYVLICALASRPLTAEEQMVQEQQRMYYETKRHNEQMEQIAREQELNKPRLNSFGMPLEPKLPQNCKLLQIHVRYHNGTSGMWQKVGIEHEVREMLENDPRIASFDVGLLCKEDYGRYADY